VSDGPGGNAMTAAQVGAAAEALMAELRKVVLGQERVLREVTACFLARGHVLLEGVPGTAKTLLVRSIAMAVDARFTRVQFTPDLMPADVTGVNMFHPEDRAFRFLPGPVFTDLLLADEINRAPAKTQSALLEAMQERRVTVDGTPRALPPLFTTFATQNPVEYEGTYPLPEAELDRFLAKVVVGYPSEAEERGILDRYAAGFDAERDETFGVEKVLDPARVEAMRAAVETVVVEPGVRGYCASIVRATREGGALSLGASPRATVALFKIARAAAAMRGRDFVTPDDVKDAAPAVLRHRVALTPEAEIEGDTPDAAVRRVLDRVEVPEGAAGTTGSAVRA
jgi:MoxR-like ATPase